MINLDTATRLLRGLRKEIKLTEGGIFLIEMRSQNYSVTAEELQDYLGSGLNYFKSSKPV